jgi:hypothetical protein
MVGVEVPGKLLKPGSVLPKLLIVEASALVRVPVPVAVQRTSESIGELVDTLARSKRLWEPEGISDLDIVTKFPPLKDTDT